MSPRRPDTSPQVSKDTPGPGAYDQAKFYLTMRNNGNIRIGTSKRVGIPNADKTLPAPNQYSSDASIIFKKDPRPIFGSSERPSINQ